MPKVVEVRLGCTLHELTEDQVFGLLKDLDDLETSVGLGYGDEAAIVILDVHDAEAARVGEGAATSAREYGLTPSLVEVLDPAEYEARAWDEVDV